MVFLSHSSFPSSSKHTAQVSQWLVYLSTCWASLNLGMKLLKCSILLAYDMLLMVPLLRHLKMKIPMAIRNTSRKIPPIMKRNLINKSQKSIRSIYNCKVSEISPSATNLMPRTKPQGDQLACFSKSSNGVVSFIHPSLISQLFPPGSALLLFRISILPLSSQTSMVQLLVLEAVWHIQKMRMTYESTSCVMEKNVQLLWVTVVAMREPSFISYAGWVQLPTKPVSHAQQLLDIQQEFKGHVSLAWRGVINGVSRGFDGVVHCWLMA